MNEQLNPTPEFFIPSQALDIIEGLKKLEWKNQFLYREWPTQCRSVVGNTLERKPYRVYTDERFLALEDLHDPQDIPVLTHIFNEGGKQKTPLVSLQMGGHGLSKEHPRFSVFSKPSEDEGLGFSVGMDLVQMTAPFFEFRYDVGEIVDDATRRWFKETITHLLGLPTRF